MIERINKRVAQWRARIWRLAERLAQLRLDYDPSPSQLQLLRVVARHLNDAERASRALVRTRASNAARRLLADIPRKPEPSPPNPLQSVCCPPLPLLGRAVIGPPCAARPPLHGLLAVAAHAANLVPPIKAAPAANAHPRPS